MPRGYQWSLSDIRNAERMAKIQAEAMREALEKKTPIDALLQKLE